MTSNADPQASEPPHQVDSGDGLERTFTNSAHPPIHRLNEQLSPEEFELVFQANRAETVVYRIVLDHQAPDDIPVVLTQHRLTFHRKQADGRRQVGILFEAINPDLADWMLDSAILDTDLTGSLDNVPEVLELLAEAGDAEIHFDIEDCLDQAGKLPFARLLYLMKAARLGRPSTYAATLRRLFEDSTVLTLDGKSGCVTLTPAGTELGARLKTRCDDLTSTHFARMLDGKLNAVAAGSLPPQDFLAWVLSLTRPGDPLAAAAAAKLWHSVDDLRAERISASNRLEGKGGFISPPNVSSPDDQPGSPPPNLDE